MCAVAAAHMILASLCHSFDRSICFCLWHSDISDGQWVLRSECFASLWWWLPNQTNVRKNRTENFSPMHKWWNPKTKETNSGARKERQIGNHLGAFALLQCNSTRRKAKLESAAPDPILCSILYRPLPSFTSLLVLFQQELGRLHSKKILSFCFIEQQLKEIASIAFVYLDLSQWFI